MAGSGMSSPRFVVSKGESLGITPGSNECGSFSHCTRFVFLSRAIHLTNSPSYSILLSLVTREFNKPSSFESHRALLYLISSAAADFLYLSPVDWSWRSLSAAVAGAYAASSMSTSYLLLLEVPPPLAPARDCQRWRHRSCCRGKSPRSTASPVVASAAAPVDRA